MAAPTTTIALELAGKLGFFSGGMEVENLIGSFIKEITSDGQIISQSPDGNEHIVHLSDLLGSLASGASTRTIHSAPVAIANANFVDAGFDWPDLIPFLLVQWNPGGRRQHASFAIIYNPKLGRYPGDETGLTAAAVGDAPGAANSIGYAVPFSITGSTRAVEAAQASFGITSDGSALIACSDPTQDPNPLVVLAIVPSQGGGGGTGTLPAGLEEIAIGGGLTPTGVGNWHAYETTQLIEPAHTYEFLMQKGADDTVLLPTIAFTGKELISDVLSLITTLATPMTRTTSGTIWESSTALPRLAGTLSISPTRRGRRATQPTAC